MHDILNIVLTFLVTFISHIKFRHILFIIIALFIFNYYILQKSNVSIFQSAIYCKSDVKIGIRNEEKHRELLHSMGDDYVQLEKEFYDLMTTLTLNCRNEEHLGPPEDGGYDVCLDPRNDINPPCLVYSFGIGDDFKFEKDVVNFLHCEVHAFDPSMGLKSHKVSENIFFHDIGLFSLEMKDPIFGWSLKPLNTIIEQFSPQKNIDLLKMDIEFSEWAVLEQMLENGSHKAVRQLIVEVHTPEMDILQRPGDGCTRTQPHTLHYMLDVLRRLKEEGFVLFSSRTNQRVKFESQISGLERHCCYNLHFVNTKHPHNYYPS